VAVGQPHFKGKMTEKTKSIFAFFVGLLLLILIAALGSPASSHSEPALRFMPVPPKLEYSIFRTGGLEVAKVFGRTQGCYEADAELIEEVNSAATRTGLDPKIVAATVAVESGCNQLAISSRGAVGLMQIRPAIWCEKYDCTKTYNFLNRHDNVQVGVFILSDLVNQYGIQEGVRRYQGIGRGCETCDDLYAEKILKLAGRK
jgi:hypothetical protein